MLIECAHIGMTSERAESRRDTIRVARRVNSIRSTECCRVGEIRRDDGGDEHLVVSSAE